MDEGIRTFLSIRTFLWVTLVIESELQAKACGSSYFGRVIQHCPGRLQYFCIESGRGLVIRSMHNQGRDVLRSGQACQPCLRQPRLGGAKERRGRGGRRESRRGDGEFEEREREATIGHADCQLLSPRAPTPQL